MDFKIDKGTGYMYCYAPNHYCANKAGKVMEHVYIMAEEIKRPLASNECVHHIDRNKTNNDISNLRLMTQAEHTALHMLEDREATSIERKCEVCEISFISFQSDERKYCSHTCASKASRKFEISKEDLEFLVWSKPTTEVAKDLGVSDSAIGKRCKKLNIEKPPRGYWAKVAANKLP